MTEEVRRPCPFCGSMEMEITRFANGRAAMTCKLCDARGPICINESKAEKHWNLRWIPTEGEA